MKRCINCGQVFSAVQHTTPCPFCDTVVALVDGVPCYAPTLARESPGFNPEHFARLATVEDGHFWFRARNELVIHVLRKYFPQARTMLEIGCGTGYVLRGVTHNLPNLSVSGSEIFLEGLAFASRRVPGADLFQMDAQQIPYANEFDVIGAFDVIEHIEDDQRVLREIHRALKPGAAAVFTVPQHPGLWSSHDDKACHKRRYRRHELSNKLQAAGFRIIFSTSFISLLLPMLALSRWRKRHRDNAADTSGEFTLPAWLNGTLYRILQLEQWLIRRGLRIPIGGSRLVAAIKVAPAAAVSSST